MGMFDAKTGGLVTLWKTFSGVTDLVGESTSARIYPGVAKQTASLPYLLFTVSGGDSFPVLGAATKIHRVALQVFSCGATRAAADALDAALRTAFDNYRGAAGSNYINQCVASPPDHGYDKPEDGSSALRYWARTVYDIHFAV